MSAPIPVKIVVAGGFAVGKTTFVRSLSEIEPLTTEAHMTKESERVDDVGSAIAKQGTTVAMDFGRITLSDELILYVFGTPGQDRFQFMWNELVRGAIGSIVLIDSNRLDACFSAIDYMENKNVPFVVGLNMFDGKQYHRVEDIRQALAIDENIPIIPMDARNDQSVRNAVIELVKHAISLSSDLASV